MYDLLVDIVASEKLAASILGVKILRLCRQRQHVPPKRQCLAKIIGDAKPHKTIDFLRTRP